MVTTLGKIVRTIIPLVAPAGATRRIHFMNKNYIVWALGLGIMLILYFAGNPFGVYDDIVIIAGLILYTISSYLVT